VTTSLPEVPRDPLEGLVETVEAVTGSKPTPKQAELFRLYLGLLLSWNRVHRLIGPGSAEDTVRSLLSDAVLFLARVPTEMVKVVDIGAGAGIPGLPMRLVRTDMALTLVESRRKPVSFLSTAKRELGLADVAILEGRAGIVIRDRKDLQSRFDVAVSRGVGLAIVHAAWAYLKPGGLFLAGGAPKQRVEPEFEAFGIKSETVAFPALGLTRTFLIGHKAS
jgi:16S rRNA (guanine527-N7)-methyltransferase